MDLSGHILQMISARHARNPSVWRLLKHESTTPFLLLTWIGIGGLCSFHRHPPVKDVSKASRSCCDCPSQSWGLTGTVRYFPWGAPSCGRTLRSSSWRLFFSRLLSPFARLFAWTTPTARSCFIQAPVPALSCYSPSSWYYSTSRSFHIDTPKRLDIYRSL